MSDWRLDRILEELTSERIILGSVWAGLAALTVTLLIMMRTHWGQSQPLRKCVFLSLLAHLLLGMYAFTIRIATSATGDDGETAMTVQSVDTFVDGETADQSGEEIPDDAPDDPDAEKPWEVLTTTPTPKPALPDTVEPAKPENAPLETPQVAPAPAIPAESKMSVPVPAPARYEPAPAKVAAAPPTPPREATSAPAAAAEKVEQPAIVEAPSPTGDANEKVADSAAPVTGEAMTPPGGNVTELAPVAPLVGGVAGVAAATAAPAAEIYQNRTAPDRAARAQRYGATAQTEAAVQAALRWLAASQSSDGRWDASRFGAGVERRIDGQDRQGAGADADTGITGLALLAFLGAGHTHQTGDYAATVDRGLKFLIASQARDGSLGGEAKNYAFMYCHGISSLALTEAYGMTHDAALLEPVQRAVGYTLAAQHPTTGGWRYRPWRERPGDRGDMSQFGWQLMVIHSAELAGLAIPDTNKQALERFLQIVAGGAQGGLASYRPGERASPTMTAEALVCRQFMGLRRETPLAREAGDYLMQALPAEGARNAYYWYYGTLASFQLQGTHWERWNASMQKALVGTQVTAGGQAGSWEPDPQWGGYGGRVYSTSLGALCLEVYFRYLPLHAETTAAKPDGETKRE